MLEVVIVMDAMEKESVQHWVDFSTNLDIRMTEVLIKIDA